MGLSEEALEVLVLGALLHDVGKLGVPGTILQKSGPLTPREREIVERHAEIGARIIELVWCLRGIAPVIRHPTNATTEAATPRGSKRKRYRFRRV